MKINTSDRRNVQILVIDLWKYARGIAQKTKIEKRYYVIKMNERL